MFVTLTLGLPFHGKDNNMADFLLSIKGIVPPEQSVSLGEAPDAAKAIPKQPEVTTSTDMSPSTALDNWDGFKALESAFKNFVDIINQSGLISNSKLNAEMKKISSQFDVGAAEQKLGSFRDTSVNESKTGTMLDAAPIPEGSYIIKEGDTASQIAADNLFTLTQLKESNPHIEDFDNIEVGQYLNFPPVGEAKAGQILVEEEADSVDWKTLSFSNATVGQAIEDELSNKNLNDSIQTVFGEERGRAIQATIDAESGGQLVAENFTYSLQRALDTFSQRHEDSIREVFRQHSVDSRGRLNTEEGKEALANAVYGGRNGNAAHEGYLYRGRGYIQLTGKNNYERIGEVIGEDLVGNPDLLLNPDIAKKATIAYFYFKKDEGKNIFDSLNADKLSDIVGHATDTAEDRWRSANVPAELSSAYSLSSSLRPKAKPSKEE